MKRIKLIIAIVAAAGALTLQAQSVFKSSLPVKPGKGVTVAGTVECDGRPVAGVVVSDGYELTKTDKKGAYYLKSKKQNPQVFMTIPSGYEAVREDVVPQFWADFNFPADQYERHDFQLRKVDNSKHAIIYLADIHLANQRNDVKIFQTDYTNRICQEVKRLEGEGIPVYTINLGDGSWDNYWRAHKFNIHDLRRVLNEADYPTPFFNVMGNHDNDGGIPTCEDIDFKASLPYQQAFGPRYYSMNIGDVHYVVLDDIQYINEATDSPLYPGVAGRRNYKECFTPEQLAWLRKDLAEVSRDTPVVLNMHGQMFKWAAPDGSSYRIRTDKESTEELLSILAPYADVHSFCGHSHKQGTVRPADHPNLVEHNISGTSGGWWRTRATGLKNLCPDGTPTAFEVLTADGKELIWDHVPYEFDSDKKFFVWDSNGLRDYYENSDEVKAFLNNYKQWRPAKKIPQDYVYVNLWSWDPKGKLTITENGKELTVEPVNEENPYYTLSYALRCTLWVNMVELKSFQKPQKFQLFRAKASTADAPVTVTWTDPFGRQTTETLSRPAPFALYLL